MESSRFLQKFQIQGWEYTSPETKESWTFGRLFRASENSRILEQPQEQWSCLNLFTQSGHRTVCFCLIPSSAVVKSQIELCWSSTVSLSNFRNSRPTFLNSTQMSPDIFVYSGLPIIQFNSIDASSWLNWKLCKQRAQLIELIESILQRLQPNSTGVVVGNYHES